MAKRTLLLFKIYLLTILVGTILGILILGILDLGEFGIGLSLAFVGSLPGLALSLITNYFFNTHELDDFEYFRVMLRVLGAILTLTFIVLFLGYDLGQEFIRVYFVYCLTAISLTFYFLKPKKK